MKFLKLYFATLILLSACNTDNSEAKVFLNQNFATIVVDEEFELEVIITPDDASNKTVSWTSNKPEIASVTDNGVVTGIAPGIAVVTVTMQNGGKSADCVVTVRSTFVAGISISLGNDVMYVGETASLNVDIFPSNAANKALEWESSAPDIVSVDDGVVTALRTGSATVTAYAADGSGVSGNIEIIVAFDENMIRVAEITISHSATVFNIGETLNLNVIVSPNDAAIKELEWHNSAPDVASLDNGVVTARSVGSTVITASATDDSGVTAEITINVSRRSSHPVIIVGYMPEWMFNQNRPNPISDFSFLSIPDRVYFFHIYPNSQGDWSASNSIINRIAQVRSHMRPEQEYFLCVGGGAGAVPPMFAMGATEAKREAYATALVNFAHQHNFDGIDMDWETNWSTSPATHVPRDQLLDLMTRIRNKMNALPSSTTVKKLSIALDSQVRGVDYATDLNHLIDYINLMVYDVYEGGVHAPLSMYRTSLQRLVTAGISKDKILGGVPFYGDGRDYRVLWEDSGGTLTADMNSFTVGATTHRFNGANLIREKTRHIIDNDYRGLMIWDLTKDLPFEHPLSLMKTMRETIETAQ